MRLSKIKVCTQNCWPATVTVIETNWSFKFLKKWWNTLFVDLFMLLHALTYYEKKFCNVFVQRKHLIWFEVSNSCFNYCCYCYCCCCCCLYSKKLFLFLLRLHIFCVRYHLYFLETFFLKKVCFDYFCKYSPLCCKSPRLHPLLKWLG